MTPDADKWWWGYVLLLLAMLIGLVLIVGLANDREYSHPCTEDEFIDITGECVHIDKIVEGES